MMASLGFPLLVTACVLGVACGGTSRSSEEPGSSGSGQGGSSNTGGSNTGGSNTGGSNTGGSNTGGSNTGGSNTGGSSATGGSIGGAGGTTAGRGGASSGGTAAGGGSGDAGASGTTNGSGGAAGGDACALTPSFVAGECPTMVYFDPTTSECAAAAPFTCAQNENVFASIAECVLACPGSRPAATACDAPTDCVVASSGCCGLCPDAPFESAVGVNRARLADHRPCGDVECEPCAEVNPVSSVSQYYLPTCQMHQCRVVDLRTTVYTECTGHSDCFLRLGIDCCERCSGEGWVALSSTDFLNGNCTDIGCPECEPIQPVGLESHCVSDRCTLVDVPAAN